MHCGKFATILFVLFQFHITKCDNTVKPKEEVDLLNKECSRICAKDNAIGTHLEDTNQCHCTAVVRSKREPLPTVNIDELQPHNRQTRSVSLDESSCDPFCKQKGYTGSHFQQRLKYCKCYFPHSVAYDTYKHDGSPIGEVFPPNKDHDKVENSGQLVPFHSKDNSHHDSKSDSSAHSGHSHDEDGASNQITKTHSHSSKTAHSGISDNDHGALTQSHHTHPSDPSGNDAHSDHIALTHSKHGKGNSHINGHDTNMEADNGNIEPGGHQGDHNKISEGNKLADQTGENKNGNGDNDPLHSNSQKLIGGTGKQSRKQRRRNKILGEQGDRNEGSENSDGDGYDDPFKGLESHNPLGYSTEKQGGNHGRKGNQGKKRHPDQGNQNSEDNFMPGLFTDNSDTEGETENQQQKGRGKNGQDSTMLGMSPGNPMNDGSDGQPETQDQKGGRKKRRGKNGQDHSMSEISSGNSMNDVSDGQPENEHQNGGRKKGRGKKSRDHQLPGISTGNSMNDDSEGPAENIGHKGGKRKGRGKKGRNYRMPDDKSMIDASDEQPGTQRQKGGRKKGRGKHGQDMGDDIHDTTGNDFPDGKRGIRNQKGNRNSMDSFDGNLGKRNSKGNKKRQNGKQEPENGNPEDQGDRTENSANKGTDDDSDPFAALPSFNPYDDNTGNKNEKQAKRGRNSRRKGKNGKNSNGHDHDGNQLLPSSEPHAEVDHGHDSSSSGHGHDSNSPGHDHDSNSPGHDHDSSSSGHDHDSSSSGHSHDSSPSDLSHHSSSSDLSHDSSPSDVSHHSSSSDLSHHSSSSDLSHHSSPSTSGHDSDSSSTHQNGNSGQLVLHSSAKEIKPDSRENCENFCAHKRYEGGERFNAYRKTCMCYTKNNISYDDYDKNGKCISCGRN